ncbi:MAG: hypothetical protein SO152_07915, partial [Ruminococcus sp.]|nr:hypothetical protein [Ruminococcus sp.]
MKCSNAFKSVFSDSLRRFLPFSIAYWALLVYVYPISEGINYLQLHFMKNVVSDFGGKLADNANIYVFECVYLAMIFATVISFIAFSYLHNKRSMDFYGSMPVSRRTQFFGRMVAVVASTIVPLIIVCLIGNGVVLFRGFEDAVSAFLCGTVGILGNIAFIAFIAVCCGTVGHSIVTYILISGVYPVCVLVLTLYPQMVLPGMSGFSNFGEFPVSPVVLSLLSPFIAPICAYGSGLIENVLNALISSSTISTGTTVSVFYYVWWIVFTAGLVVATYFLVKKRKSESAQSGFAFVFPSVAIKFFTSVTTGLLMGLILASISSIPYVGGEVSSVSYIILFSIGIIIGTIISHIILHLIYHRGMSGFGKWMILYGCEALVSLIFFAIVTTGMFGYVTRVPDVEDVKSVEITFSSCVDPEIKIKGKNPQIYSTSDPESIKSIIEYHSAVAQEYEKQCSGIYTPVENYGNDEEYENYNGDGLYLRYTDKKGNQITRAYSNPTLVFKHTRIIGDIIGSIDSGDGIVGKAPIDRCSELDMYIEGWKDFKDGNYIIKDKDVIKKLIENYNKDIDNLGLLSEDGVFEEDNMSYYGIDCNIYYTTDDG